MMALEIELKLSIQPNDIPLLQQHPLILKQAIAEPKTQHILNTYFDTIDYMLRTAGVGLRIREINQEYFQTLKFAGKKTNGGLFERQEFEYKIVKPELDFNLISNDELRLRLQESAIAGKIIPLFQTDFWRTLWQLQLSDGTCCELAIDQGFIQVKDIQEPLCEIELELKDGQKSSLVKFAQELQQYLPLTVAEKSKAGRGYQLHQAVQNMQITSVKNVTNK